MNARLGCAACLPSDTLASMTITSPADLTAAETLAELDVEQLKQLIGLVDYDASKDPFPVTGWDAIVFVVGNATQSAHYYQSAWGMELIAYSGPETGNRDHKAFVLKSGSIKFVVKGAVSPDSPLIAHHAKHGDGVLDIGLEVPALDRCIAQARQAGARIIEEPHARSDEFGVVRLATIATYGDRSGCSRPSTTSSAMWNSARWTNGWRSITGSWGSLTWPSLSGTTSRRTTPR